MYCLTNSYPKLLILKSINKNVVQTFVFVFHRLWSRKCIVFSLATDDQELPASRYRSVFPFVWVLQKFYKLSAVLVLN